MAACTAHAHERRAQRGIKQVYIDLCLKRGARSNAENRDTSAGKTPFLHRYYKNGLVVISVPNKTERVVVTAYWATTSHTEIESCKSAFERQIAKQKHKNAKRAAKRAQQKKLPKKSGTRTTKACNVSVEVTWWEAKPWLEMQRNRQKSQAQGRPRHATLALK